MSLRMYVVKKLVLAESVAAAVKREKQVQVDSCYIDDDWMRMQQEREEGNPIKGFRRLYAKAQKKAPNKHPRKGKEGGNKGSKPPHRKGVHRPTRTKAKQVRKAK